MTPAFISEQRSGNQDRRARWQSIARKLGYAEHTKCLIIHADDLGMAKSINEATFEALERKAISSASFMVPCPWFPEVVDYVKSHPQADLGVHLTITSEWKPYAWRPMEPPDRVSSLIDVHGYLWKCEKDVACHAVPQEARLEIEAQISSALRCGIEVTHLDSHMFVLLSTPSLAQMLLRTAERHKLPVRVTEKALSFIAPSHLDRLNLPLAACYQMKEEVQPNDWFFYYENILKALEPGISELIVHLGHDCNELRAIMGGDVAWGPSWRQRDFDVVTSIKFRRLLAQNDIHLITWRDLRRLAWLGSDSVIDE